VPAVVVARAALAVERGDSVAKRDEALSPFAGSTRLRVARGFFPCGQIGPRDPLGRRWRRLPWRPHRSSRPRAGPGVHRGCARLDRRRGSQSAAPLIKVQDLSTEQVKAVSARLDKVGGADPAAAALSQEIKSRQAESEQVRAAAGGAEKPWGRPRRWRETCIRSCRSSTCFTSRR